MTVPGWGRVTPLQGSILELAGYHLDVLTEPTDESLQIGIARGRAELVAHTGQDFEYDLQRWHDWLWESHREEYSYGGASVPRAIQQAVNSVDRSRLVEMLRVAREPLSSERMALEIVETLIEAGLVERSDLRSAVDVVRKEIRGRKLLGEYCTCKKVPKID